MGGRPESPSSAFPWLGYTALGTDRMGGERQPLRTRSVAAAAAEADCAQSRRLAASAGAAGADSRVPPLGTAASRGTWQRREPVREVRRKQRDPTPLGKPFVVQDAAAEESFFAQQLMRACAYVRVGGGAQRVLNFTSCFKLFTASAIAFQGSCPGFEQEIIASPRAGRKCAWSKRATLRQAGVWEAEWPQSPGFPFA